MYSDVGLDYKGCDENKSKLKELYSDLGFSEIEFKNISLEDFVAFKAALALLKETNQYDLIEKVYEKCKQQVDLEDHEVKNFVKEVYEPFTYEQVSNKIAELLCDETIEANVEVIYQKVDKLHEACPKNLGDWYFTGDYPTPGGNRVVNRAFINFFEGNKERAYL